MAYPWEAMDYGEPIRFGGLDPDKLSELSTDDPDLAPWVEEARELLLDAISPERPPDIPERARRMAQTLYAGARTASHPVQPGATGRSDWCDTEWRHHVDQSRPRFEQTPVARTPGDLRYIACMLRLLLGRAG